MSLAVFALVIVIWVALLVPLARRGRAELAAEASNGGLRLTSGGARPWTSGNLAADPDELDAADPDGWEDDPDVGAGPVAAAVASRSRRRRGTAARRRRVLVVLVVATAAGARAWAVLGGRWWAAAAVAGLLLAGYLAALVGLALAGE